MTSSDCVLQDSGERTEFSSGAVRDLAAGKGRCDLLPIDSCCALLDYEFVEPSAPEDYRPTDILMAIEQFMNTGDPENLIRAVKLFGIVEGMSDWQMIRMCAHQLEDGAVKYGERNWERGIPLDRYVDSGIRHLTKYYDEWSDEPHDRAFVWNMLCGYHTAKANPDLNPYSKNKTAPIDIPNVDKDYFKIPDTLIEGSQQIYNSTIDNLKVLDTMFEKIQQFYNHSTPIDI